MMLWVKEERKSMRSGFGLVFSFDRWAGFNFSKCFLVGATFRFPMMDNYKFCGADLRYANFGALEIDGSDFSRADLRGADLGHVRYWEYACFFRAVYDKETRLPDKRMKRWMIPKNGCPRLRKRARVVPRLPRKIP